MLPLLRYTLAAIFLTASVGCLGLWLAWTNSQFSLYVTGWGTTLNTYRGTACARFGRGSANGQRIYLNFGVYDSMAPEWILAEIERQGPFGRVNRAIYFPLWYPALVFALAAGSVLRLGRPFTIRAALIATAVVAGLLGMVVGL